MSKPFIVFYCIVALSRNFLIGSNVKEDPKQKSQSNVQQLSQVIPADTSLDLLDHDVAVGPPICIEYNEQINCSIDGNKYKLVDRIDKLGYIKAFPRDDDIVINKLAIFGFNSNSPKKYILNNDAISTNVYPSLEYAAYELDAESEAIQVINDLKINQHARSICIRNGTYCLNDQIFKGGHGEIFRAYTIDIEGNVFRNVSYILKRMQTAGKFHIKMCAECEI